jgi:uncharacterized protein
MPIVSLYAALLTLLFVGLSIRTLRIRRRLRIAVGDGGNQAMLRAMRVHSNFAEYVPLSLLLIYLVEQNGASALFVHFLGLCILAGRISHAVGVSRVNEQYLRHGHDLHAINSRINSPVIVLCRRECRLICHSTGRAPASWIGPLA